MTNRKSSAAGAGVSTAVAAIVIVIVACGTAVVIVELQLSSANHGGINVATPTITATATTGCQGCGPSTNTAQFAVTATSLRSADFKTNNCCPYFSCGSAAGSFLTVSGQGTSPPVTTVTEVTINWAGHTNSYSYSYSGQDCLVGPAGVAPQAQNILFTARAYMLGNAVTGGTFTGTVTLADGEVLIFTGTFQ